MIKTVNVSIEGITPLMMHQYPLEPIEAIEKKSPKEQAEIAAYRDSDNEELYVPGVAIQRAFVQGATYVKGKGRASLQKQAAACILVMPEKISLGTKEYAIDTRPVVIAATKGRILRHRPRFDKWKMAFEIEYDDALISPVELRSIVDNTGMRVGLLEFRPERKGPYGRFVVTVWEN